MRTVAVVTGSRSDYGCLLPILRRIQETPGLKLQLLVTGMHLSEKFGLTVREIEADGFDIEDRIDLQLSSDSPEGIADAMGRATAGFSKSFGRSRPDLLLVLGDRFEMHAAAVASIPFKIPLAHVHGGEVTQGAMDDVLRHSLTKLSHLHFVAARESVRRVLQMGEEPWRVILSGAPSLDNLREVPLLGKEELAGRLKIPLGVSPLLVTYHPVTLEYEQTHWQIEELLSALSQAGLPVVFTAPNADTYGSIIRSRIEAYVREHPGSTWLVPNLGTQLYFSLMKWAAAMVGNSSSGLVEAPSFELPVVNIGTRQEGRTRGGNVVEVGYHRAEIASGVGRAVSAEFRQGLKGMANPYGDGRASEVIAQQLREIPIDDRLIRKRFINLSWSPEWANSIAGVR